MNRIDELELLLCVNAGDVAGLLTLFRSPAKLLAAKELLFRLTETEPIKHEGAVRTLYAAFELYNDGERVSLLVSS